MGDLFLSHSHKDKGFVRLLAFDLRAAGVEVWHDEDEIRGADQFVTGIADALETSSYVGACLSQSSVPSNWVKTEIEIAIAKEINENRIIVLPFLIQDCQIPTLLLHKAFIDLRNPVMYERAFREIVLRIKPEALPDDESVQSLLVVDGERTEFLVKAATHRPGLSKPGSAEAEDWVRGLDHGLPERHESGPPGWRGASLDIPGSRRHRRFRGRSTA